MTTEPQSTALERRPDPELDRYARIGTWLAAAESEAHDPKSLGAAAALRLYYIAELNLPPWAATEINFIKGRVVPSAKLFRALAAREGLDVRPVDDDDKSCTAVLVDRASGEEIGRSTYTMEMARKAGLIRPRSAWETHPQRMLWARAAKFVLDDYAPQVTLGMLSEDEAVEVTGGDAPAASAPLDEVTDGDWEDAVEDAVEEERRKRLLRQMYAILNSADDAKAPALPNEEPPWTWDRYSRWLTHQRFKVESRGDLTADQLADLIKTLDAEVRA